MSSAYVFPQVSHYIVIAMDHVPVKGKANPEWEDMCSVACAVQVGLLRIGCGLDAKLLEFTTGLPVGVTLDAKFNMSFFSVKGL